MRGPVHPLPTSFNLHQGQVRPDPRATLLQFPFPLLSPKVYLSTLKIRAGDAVFRHFIRQIQ